MNPGSAVLTDPLPHPETATLEGSARYSGCGGMKKGLVLLAAVVAYLGFLGVFTYAAGFVNGAFVPKGIDDGPPGTPLGAILVNVAFLAAFAIQHTIMARPAFKAKVASLGRAGLERSTFVAVAAGILVGLFVGWRPLPEVVWQVEAGWLRALLRAGSLVGFGLVVLSSFQIDHFHLFGLKQAFNAVRGRPEPAPRFRIAGLYRYVRHPLMTGFLLAFWCAPTMSEGRLLFAAVTTAYILVGTRIEERDLIREHGEPYLRYRRAVPALIPWRGRVIGADATAVTGP